MHLLVLAIFGKYIAYVIFCADIARLLQYSNNISDRFRYILAILQYFHGIFLQYCLNISVLCGLCLSREIDRMQYLEVSDRGVVGNKIDLPAQSVEVINHVLVSTCVSKFVLLLLYII